MRRLSTVILTAIALHVSIARADDPPQAIEPVAPQLDRAVDFNLDVFPVLESKCLACHNKRIAESDMVLESVADILAGGGDGQVVVPGKPDESRMYILASRADEPAMPPLPNKANAKPLTPQELGLLRQWIEDGAKPGVAAPVDSALDWQAVPSSVTPILSVALSPDERFVAAGRANRIVIYDLPGQREVTELTDPALLAVMSGDHPMYGPGEAHRDFVHALAFSPDGNLLASAGYRVVKLWERQRNVQLARLAAESSVTRLAVNADGTAAATAHADNTVRLWNLATSQAGATLPAHPAAVNAAGFAPNGELLVTGAEDGILRVWRADSGEAVAELTTPSPIRALTLNADGTQVITGHADNVIRVWSTPAATAATPPQPVLEVKGHGQPITALVRMPKTNEVLSGSEDGTVRVFNLENGNQGFNQNLGAPVTSVAVSEDGESIAGASGALARVWAKDGKQKSEFKGDPVLAAQIVTLTDEQTVAQQRRGLAEAAEKAAEEDVTSRETSLTQANEQKTKTDTALAEAETKVQEAEQKLKDAVAALEGDPENGDLKKKRDDAQKEVDSTTDARNKAQDAADSAERAVNLSQEALDNSKMRRDAAKQAHEAENQATQAAEATVAQANEQAGQPQPPFRAITLSADGKQVAVGRDDGRIQLYDSATGKYLESFEGHTQAIAGLAFLENGSLVSASADQSTVVWETEPGWKLVARLGANPEQPLDVSNSPFVDRVLCLDFSPDGTLLATGGGNPSRSGELLIWNVADRTVVRELRDAHSDTVFDVEFSWDGKFLASGAADKFMKVHSVETGELVRAYEGHTDHVLGVAWKADGGTLASCGADNSVKLWNVTTGEQQRTITTHSKQVTDVDFVGTQDIIVTASGDKTVRSFNGNNGSPRRSFGGNGDFVYTVTTGRDETYVIGGGEDGVLRVWNGTNGQLLLSFEPPAPSTETAAVN
jgi:WD40 repeat protein